MICLPSNHTMNDLDMEIQSATSNTTLDGPKCLGLHNVVGRAILSHVTKALISADYMLTHCLNVVTDLCLFVVLYPSNIKGHIRTGTDL